MGQHFPSNQLVPADPVLTQDCPSPKQEKGQYEDSHIDAVNAPSNK